MAFWLYSLFAIPEIVVPYGTAEYEISSKYSIEKSEGSIINKEHREIPLFIRNNRFELIAAESFPFEIIYFKSEGEIKPYILPGVSTLVKNSDYYLTFILTHEGKISYTNLVKACITSLERYSSIDGYIEAEGIIFNSRKKESLY